MTIECKQCKRQFDSQPNDNASWAKDICNNCRQKALPSGLVAWSTKGLASRSDFAIKDTVKGITELMKNSRAAYEREGYSYKREHKVIHIYISEQLTDSSVTISCLDFGGMTKEQFDTWSIWGNPDATPQEATKYSGMGTGGKRYLTGGFTGPAGLFSFDLDPENKVKLLVMGGGTIIGQTLEERYNSLKGESRDFTMQQERNLFEDEGYNTVLKHSSANGHIDYSDVIHVTIAYGNNPVQNNKYARSNIEKIIDRLRLEPAAGMVMRTCNVYFWHNGELLNQTPLLPKELQSEHEPIIHTIPDLLVYDNEEVDTKAHKQAHAHIKIIQGKRINEKDIPFTQNIVQYFADGEVIGYIRVSKLYSNPIARNFSVEVHLDSLRPIAANDWGRLNDDPLSNAINDFIVVKLRELVKTFENPNVEIDISNYKGDALLDEAERALFGPDGEETDESGYDTPSSPNSTPALEIAEPDTIKLSKKHFAYLAEQASTEMYVEYYKNDTLIQPININSQNPHIEAKPLNDIAHSKPIIFDSMKIQFDKPGDYNLTVKTSTGLSDSRIIAVRTMKHIRPRHNLNSKNKRIYYNKKTNVYHMQQGASMQLKADGEDINGKELKDVCVDWIIPDKQNVSIGPSGKIKALSTTGTVSVTINNPFGKNFFGFDVSTEYSKGKSNKSVYLSGVDDGPDGKTHNMSASEGKFSHDGRYHDVWWINTQWPEVNAIHTRNHAELNSFEWRLYVMNCYVDIKALKIMKKDIEEDIPSMVTQDYDPITFHEKWQGIRYRILTDESSFKRALDKLQPNSQTINKRKIA